MNKKHNFGFGKCLVILIAILLTSALFIGCGGDDADGPTITVASKPWTEQMILGNMLLDLFEYHGYPVEDRIGLGESDVIRPAIYSDEVDIYWEYTGTTLTTMMDHEAVGDPDEAYQLVKEWDQEENNLVWLEYSEANNAYVLLMREDDANEKGIVTISDLADYINDNPGELVLGCNEVFYEREDGVQGLEETYGFEFADDNITFLSTGLYYDALRQGEVDVAEGFGTDGRIPAFDLVIIEDNKEFFPVYNPAPVVRQEILDAYPELEETINELTRLLDHDTLTELNEEVDIEELEPEEVAETFLRDNGLID